MRKITLNKQNLVRYLYTMRLSITPDIVNEMIVVANDYNITRLLQMCEKFYVDHIQVKIQVEKLTSRFLM